jgi:hypothetical protein
LNSGGSSDAVHLSSIKCKTTMRSQILKIRDDCFHIYVKLREANREWEHFAEVPTYAEAWTIIIRLQTLFGVICDHAQNEVVIKVDKL